MDDVEDDLGERGEDEPARLERRAEAIAEDDEAGDDARRQAERELIGRDGRERPLQSELRTEE